MEHLLQKSKCSMFHNIFKYVIFQRCQKALLWSKGITLCLPVSSAADLCEQFGPKPCPTKLPGLSGSKLLAKKVLTLYILETPKSVLLQTM